MRGLDEADSGCGEGGVFEDGCCAEDCKGARVGDEGSGGGGWVEIKDVRFSKNSCRAV